MVDLSQQRTTFHSKQSICRIFGSLSDKGQVTSQVFQFSTVSIIPPLLHTHLSIYHPRCIMFSPSTSIFPCQYQYTIAPYSFIHPMLTRCNILLPVLQISSATIIPPSLYTHPFKYHPPCNMFFSHYFSFSVSISFHHCSILIHPSTTHTV